MSGDGAPGPKTMRILFTADPMIPVPPTGYGGIERIVDGLVRFCRGRGHTVGLVAKSGSAAPADALFAWPRASLSGARGTLAHVRALRRAVRAFRPDLIHSFS